MSNRLSQRSRCGSAQALRNIKRNRLSSDMAVARNLLFSCCQPPIIFLLPANYFSPVAIHLLFSCCQPPPIVLLLPATYCSPLGRTIMTESVASMHCSLLSKPQEGGRPTGAYREAGRQASMGPAACRQAEAQGESGRQNGHRKSNCVC